MNAQNKAGNQHLDAPQKNIVAISSYTAQGKMDELKLSINEGLDAGVTINEIKEVLTQLYAYCGFPRSLNGLGALASVLAERKEKGIEDVVGKKIIVENKTADKYEEGRKVLEEITKVPQAKPAPGFGEFAPRIDAFLKEHLFADIFACEVLTYQQRELATVAALASMPGVESQLGAHIGMALNVGNNEALLNDLFSVMETTVGKKEAETGRRILLNVLARGK